MEKQGDNKQAVKDITKALKLNPKYVRAYLSRGNAYARSRSYQQAIKDYSMAIKLSPKRTAFKPWKLHTFKSCLPP